MPKLVRSAPEPVVYEMRLDFGSVQCLRQLRPRLRGATSAAGCWVVPKLVRSAPEPLVYEMRLDFGSVQCL